MKKIVIAILVLLIGMGLVTAWWNYALSPLNPTNTSSQTFVIAKGDGVREVANKLHAQHLIRDQVAFFLLIKSLGIEKNIQAGSFKLSPSMSARDLALKLTAGTQDVWITIPEGWRSEQILEYLNRANSDNWRIEGVSWKSDEGRLFPDTYLVPKEMPLDAVRSLFTSTFDKKISSQLRQDAAKGGLTFDRVIILASLVEREAKKDVDRPIVASVLLNRFRAGMALDVDASVQYAIGWTHDSGWWQKNLTADDLKFKSPYNTYLNSSLPPGPICNPGLAAIRAVIYPAQTDYLYYLTDKEGKMHYSKTLDEHNQNIAKYLGQ